MSNSDDASRAAILRRRAMFISSVTALSGCGPSQAPPHGVAPATSASSRPVVNVEPSPSSHMPAPQGSVGTPSAGPKAKMPPTDTPSDINKQATQRFDWLRDELTRVHNQIDTVERELPRDCPIVDKACDAQWQKVARALLQIEERTPSQPVCPGTSKGAKLYEARVAEHAAYIAKRKEDISSALQALVAPHGDDGKKAWEAHMAAARASFPSVCLNYSCRDW